jgi:lipoyl(octanoyl) transferase
MRPAIINPSHDRLPIGWLVARDPVPYDRACAFMEERAKAIAEGSAGELIWLLEHPSMYTAGTSAKRADLLDPNRFPVHRTGRGGQYTYHGPGQRVGYVMLDVGRRFGDVRAFVGTLEQTIIEALEELGVAAETRPGDVGVWVHGREDGPDTYDKIAAIGVRLRRWVSYHGFSLNVAPDLEHFAGIVPCGVRGAAVTSLARLGVAVSTDVVDQALRKAFERRFGPTRAIAGDLADLHRQAVPADARLSETKMRTTGR